MPVVKDPTNTTATTTTCTAMVRTTTTTTTHSTTPLTSQTPTSVSLTDISQFYTCQECFCSRQFTLDEERKTIKISVTSLMTSSETEGRAKVTSEADYSHVPEIVNMVKDGYTLSPRGLICRDGVFLLMMSQQCSWLPCRTGHHLVALHESSSDILACLPITSTDIHAQRVTDVEALGMTYGVTKRMLVISVGVITQQWPGCQGYENTLLIVDCQTKPASTREYRSVGNIAMDVCVDPRPDMPVVYALRAPLLTEAEAMEPTQTLCITSHNYHTNTLARNTTTLVVPNNMVHSPDADEVMQISAPADGSHLTVQILDNTETYGTITKDTSYILDTEDLQLLTTCNGRYRKCPNLCIPDMTPCWKPCGTEFYLSEADEENNVPCLHRVPPRLSLQRQCRTTIRKHLEKIQNVLELPLPRTLQNYVQWMQ